MGDDDGDGDSDGDGIDKITDEFTQTDRRDSHGDDTDK
jgi:hypothetical protein